jgi:hypothetical protein
MATTILSSQRYINDEIVAEKINSNDITVLVSPEFSYAGGVYRVVLDGHHSLQAAKEMGVSPICVEATNLECDYIGLIEKGEIEEFLQLARIDADYYDIDTGHIEW